MPLELTELQLKTELENWFNKNPDNKKVWTTLLGKYIKSKVTAARHWKDLPRGDARKGFRELQKARMGMKEENNEL